MASPQRRLALVARHCSPMILQCGATSAASWSLRGKVAIVTGSSSGVGAAVALALADRGCDVVVNYSRSAGSAENVAKMCRERGVRVLAVAADVGTDDGCSTLVQAALDGLGRIDVLVNNAGTTKFVPHDDLDGLSSKDFMRIYDVNAVGAFRMIRGCAPHMRMQGGGRVVNVSSIAGLYGTVGSCVAYTMSKAALNALTASMGKALGPEIVVNAVCPGFIQGEWLREGMGAEAYESKKKSLEEKAPLRDTMTPATIAESVLWFLEGATHITGQTIAVDAGMGLMRGPN